jgi:hypothetical protein
MSLFRSKTVTLYRFGEPTESKGIVTPATPVSSDITGSLQPIGSFFLLLANSSAPPTKLQTHPRTAWK